MLFKIIEGMVQIFGASGNVAEVDSANNLKTVSPSVISSENSTTALLIANAEFTGEFVDVLNFGVVSILCKANQPSAIDGVRIEWSANGLDVHAEDVFDHAGTHGDQWTFGINARYFRVKYINGVSNQTGAFVIQTILHKNSYKSSSHRVSDMIDSDDDAELTKSVITGKTSTGIYRNVALDDNGHVLVSDRSDIVAPLPSLEVSNRRILTADAVFAGTQEITTKTAFKQFSFGGRGPGEGMFGRYVAGTEEFVPNGDFESAPEVANWISTGVGDGLALVPTYSTDQAYTGTGSLKLGPATRSDVNHYPQVTYTWPVPQGMDSWRYVSARFYNFAPTGGAVTRTISIRLTDVNGAVRVYSVSGLTSTAPFNANGWIQIFGEIRVPSSQVGTTFDINNVASISLRMQDSGNKSYTAIYWDTIKLIGSLTIIQKIYTNGSTIIYNFDPVKVFDVGETMYYALRNNDTVSREFQISIAGVDAT